MGSSSDMVASFLNGIRRVVNAPALLVGVYLVTLAATVPMALALHVSIASHLGNSVAADTAATGVNAEWWEEFGAQATGIERTFTPSIIGFAAVGVSMDTVVWGKVGGIVGSWIVTPLISGIIAFLIFNSAQKLIFDTENPYKQARRYVPVYMFMAGFVLSLVTPSLIANPSASLCNVNLCDFFNVLEMPKPRSQTVNSIL